MGSYETKQKSNLGSRSSNGAAGPSEAATAAAAAVDWTVKPVEAHTRKSNGGPTRLHQQESITLLAMPTETSNDKRGSQRPHVPPLRWDTLCVLA